MSGALLLTEVTLPSGSVGRLYALSIYPMTGPQFFRVQLGLNPLADLAFRDILSKLTSENIVVEMFSRFTAR
jgi:hypothetical protein